MKKSLFILPLTFMMVLSACGGEGEGSDTSGTGGDPTTSATTSGVGPTTSGPTSSSSGITPQVTGVSLDVNNLTLDIYNHDSHVLIPTVVTIGGASDAVTFESGNSSVASVSSTGLVSPVSEGNTVITVKSVFDPTKYATCPVTVTDNYPAKSHHATVSFGGGAAINLAPTKNIPEGAGGKYEYTTRLNVVKDQSIAFTFDNNPIMAGNGGDANNNTRGEYPNYVVHNDAQNANVYLKVYENDSVLSYSFWIDGYEQDPKTWYLKGSFNDWGETSPLVEDTTSTDPNVEYQYKAVRYLNVDDEFKFQRNLDEVWIGNDKVENYDDGAIRAGSDQNIVVKVAGEYTFYLKEYTDESIGLYVGYPLYLNAWYNSEIQTGNGFDMSQLAVRYHYNCVSDEVKYSSTFYYGSDEINISTYTFDHSGVYSIRVEYTVPLTTTVLSTMFDVTVKNPQGFGIKYDDDTVNLFQYIGQKTEYEIEYAQYKSEVITFTPGDVFSPFDNYTEVTFDANIENTSFTRITKEGNVFTVDPYTSAFNAIVYLKLNGDSGNKIYFETNIITSAKISINGGEFEDMSPTSGPYDDTTIVQQYAKNVVAVKDQTVAFKINNIDWYPADGTYGNLKVESHVITFVNSTFEAMPIYFNSKGEDGREIYGEYDHNVYLIGSFSSWTKDIDNAFDESPDAGYREQYSLVTHLDENDEFKIYSDRNDINYVGFEKLEDNARFEESVSDHNIKCKETGYYKIFFKIKFDSDFSIYIRHIDAEPNTLVASIGNQRVFKDYSMDASSISVYYYDSTYHDFDVKDSENLKYYIGENEIDPATYVFHTVEANKVITVKYEYDTGLFATGTFTVNVVEGINLKVYLSSGNDSDIRSWYTDGGAKFYAWIWEEGHDGHLEYVPLMNIESCDGDDKRIMVRIYVETNINHVIILRCSPDYVMNPNEFPASSWNQTSDLPTHIYENIMYADGNF